MEPVNKRICVLCGGEYWVSGDEVMFNSTKDDMTDADFDNGTYETASLEEYPHCPYCEEEEFEPVEGA
jgi:hypothetical protein